MKVKELIEQLQKMEPGADIGVLHSGALRGSADLVFMGRGGVCTIADYDSALREDFGRPLDAPRASADPYWKTPNKPETE